MNDYLYKAKTEYTETIYKKAYKKIYKKNLIVDIIGIVASLLVAVPGTIGFSNVIFLIVGLVLAASFVFFIFKDQKNINNHIKTSLINFPNLVGEYYFYEDRIEVSSKSDNSNATKTIKADEIVSKWKDNEYIYLKTKQAFIVVDLKSCVDDLPNICSLLGFKK